MTKIPNTIHRTLSYKPFDPLDDFAKTELAPASSWVLLGAGIRC